MSYEVKTRVFEGPLDLLLQLITSHKVEITELSLSDLVGEYLAHLDLMQQFDIEVTSEFLLIAATLIQLKARFLLPDDRALDLDEELALSEERDRLLSRLLACLTFKDVAAVLAHRLDGMARYVPRRAGLDPGIVPNRPPVRLGVDVDRFGMIASRVLRPVDDEPDLDHLEMDLPSVDSAISDIAGRVGREVETRFDALVAECERPIEVVVYFLALLELARWGVLGVAQDHRDAPIVVTHRDVAAPEGLDPFLGRSEWSA
jgi:segregation and condensation protein A